MAILIHTATILYLYTLLLSYTNTHYCSCFVSVTAFLISLGSVSSHAKQTVNRMKSFKHSFTHASCSHVVQEIVKIYINIYMYVYIYLCVCMYIYIYIYIYDMICVCNRISLCYIHNKSERLD